MQVGEKVWMKEAERHFYIIIWVVIATLLGTIYGSYVTPYKTHLVFGGYLYDHE